MPNNCEATSQHNITLLGIHLCEKWELCLPLLASTSLNASRSLRELLTNKVSVFKFLPYSRKYNKDTLILLDLVLKQQCGFHLGYAKRKRYFQTTKSTTEKEWYKKNKTLELLFKKPHFWDITEEQEFFFIQSNKNDSLSLPWLRVESVGKKLLDLDQKSVPGILKVFFIFLMCFVFLWFQTTHKSLIWAKWEICHLFYKKGFIEDKVF